MQAVQNSIRILSCAVFHAEHQDIALRSLKQSFLLDVCVAHVCIFITENKEVSLGTLSGGLL